MSASTGILFATLLILAYVVAPVMLFWGWIQWMMQRPRTWTIPSTLSFAGFVCASASALFAICVILYASGGGFEHTPGGPTYSPNYELFYRCIAIGAGLSAPGFVFASGGLWRKNQLRWQAPTSAIAAFAFWLLASISAGAAPQRSENYAYLPSRNSCRDEHTILLREQQRHRLRPILAGPCSQEAIMDPTVLVTYATRGGSTEEVAQSVTEVLRGNGLAVELGRASDVHAIEQYTAVVICVALYAGRMHKEVRRFLSEQRALLAKVPVALFVLGPVHSEEKEWASAREQLEKELKHFPWLTPVDQRIVGGKFDPATMGFPFKLIPALRKMPASDVRDWHAIRECAAGLVQSFRAGEAAKREYRAS